MTITYPDGTTSHASWTADNQVASTQPPSGATTTFSYSYTNPTTNQVTGLPYSVTDAQGTTTSYSYDNGNQPTAATRKSSGGSTLASYAYGYDPAGNLTSKTVNGTSTSFVYADRLPRGYLLHLPARWGAAGGDHPEWEPGRDLLLPE